MSAITQEKQQIHADTAEIIRAQVASILASDPFVRCRRMQRFLAFIVNETLSGRSDRLGEFSIGTAVFDRGLDFEPGLDPIVRNDARRLRLKLAEYYRCAGDLDGLLIEVPKGGYVPVFRRRQRESVAPRIALLPVESLSADSDLSARALSISLAAWLTSIDGLQVVAGDSFGGRSIRDLASEFTLSHVIRGSILPEGRLVVALIRTSDGVQAWAREYAMEGNDVSVLAAKVAREFPALLGLKQARLSQFALVA